MNIWIAQQFEKETKRHEEVILGLTKMCLCELIGYWTGHREESLSLQFGMGTCYVKIDGKQVWPEDYPIVNEVIQDIEDMTDNYRLVCPEDVEVR